MTSSLKKIKGNLDFLRFQITKGNIFNVEKYLNEITAEINNTGWFFTNQDKKEINKIKQILQKYSSDKKKILNGNKPTSRINIKNNSGILKKNFNHDEGKYKDYLNGYLLPKYHTKLLKEEKILQKIDFFYKKLSKTKSEYQKLIKKLVKSDNTIDVKIKAKIEIVSATYLHDVLLKIKIIS